MLPLHKMRRVVGTHRPWPREALGLLADARMRKGKKLCHELFDPFWRGNRKRRKSVGIFISGCRSSLGIPWEDCHFGYFDLELLRGAYRILLKIQGQELRYDNCGRIYFVKS